MAERFDVVIVGVGAPAVCWPGGCRSILLAACAWSRRGPDYGPYAAEGWPVELLDPRALVFTHDWGTGGEDRLARA